MDRRERLSAEELADGLSALEGWKVEEDRYIFRKMLFPSFPDAIRFVNRVAEWSEANNHHPFLSIDYRRVTLRLTTWHSGGLTPLDLEAAEAFDRLASVGEDGQI